MVYFRVDKTESILEPKSVLWTFVHTEGVKPTNKPAERQIRYAALWHRSLLYSKQNRWRVRGANYDCGGDTLAATAQHDRSPY